jgi:nuclear transcription Y subunit beta
LSDSFNVGGGGAGGSAFAMDDEVREQDRHLPVANIARIMKRVLPANEKITKEAKEAVQECVSEFISFITSEASDRCVQERRKTINGDDLLWAMGTLGFDEYSAPLKIYLQVSLFRRILSISACLHLILMVHPVVV